MNRDLPTFLALAVAALLPQLATWQQQTPPTPADRVMGVVSAATSGGKGTVIAPVAPQRAAALESEVSKPCAVPGLCSGDCSSTAAAVNDKLQADAEAGAAPTAAQSPTACSSATNPHRNSGQPGR